MLCDYKYKNFVKNEITDLDNKTNINIYNKANNQINKTTPLARNIDYLELEEIIKNYIKKGNCIFDVSALKNNLLIDITFMLLANNFLEFYCFELTKKRNFGSEDLYHNLNIEEDFIYRKLSDSKFVANSVNRISKFTVRFRWITIFAVFILSIFFAISFFYEESDILHILKYIAVLVSFVSFLAIFIPEKY